MLPNTQERLTDALVELEEFLVINNIDSKLKGCLWRRGKHLGG
jgi:hypothetical protein